MRTRQRLLLSLLAIALLACLIATAVSVNQQLRQDGLDRALIQAVKELDAPGVERLLAQGASANARDAGGPPLTLMGVMKLAVARLQGRPTSASRSVPLLLLPYDRPGVAWWRHPGAAGFPREAVSITKRLLSYAADPNVANDDGKTLVYIASFYGYDQTLAELIRRHADVNRPDCDGMTPLMVAQEESPCTSILLRAGANVDARDGEKKAAIMYAESGGRKLTLLLRAGADVNVADGMGRTRLILSAMDPEMESDEARLLISFGADPNRRDCLGRTALEYAVTNENRPVTALLRTLRALKR